MAITGIKFEKNIRGINTYVRIDLRKYGKELEDFLDILAVKQSKGEETIPWEELKSKMNKKHGLKDV